MADIAVDTAVISLAHQGNRIAGAYYIDVSIGVEVLVDSSNDLAYRRTTDKGATWAKTVIHTGTVTNLGCYFSEETNGDTNGVVHISWMDSGTSDLFYQSLDISSDSLGTLRTPSASLTVDSSPVSNRLCMTLARGGNLHVGFSTQTEIGHLRSTDSGANWTSRADFHEGTGTSEDWLKLFPAAASDNADICGVFLDRSANILSIKMYDDSGDSVTETTISTGIVDSGSTFPGFDASTQHSNNHLMVSSHSDADNSTDDLLCWDINPDSIASPTITAKTNVFTNQVESIEVAVFINQQNDDVHVAYLKGGTALASLDAVYHISTDGMGTWGSEQAYSEAAADDLRLIMSGRTCGAAGGRYQPSFFNDDLNDVFINPVNDIEIVAAAVGGRIMSSLAGSGGLAGYGGIAGMGGGLAG